MTPQERALLMAIAGAWVDESTYNSDEYRQRRKIILDCIKQLQTEADNLRGRLRQLHGAVPVMTEKESNAKRSRLVMGSSWQIDDAALDAAVAAVQEHYSGSFPRGVILTAIQAAAPHLSAKREKVVEAAIRYIFLEEPDGGVAKEALMDAVAAL
jgi:hypothetical protein